MSGADKASGETIRLLERGVAALEGINKNLQRISEQSGHPVTDFERLLHETVARPQTLPSNWGLETNIHGEIVYQRRDHDHYVVVTSSKEGGLAVLLTHAGRAWPVPLTYQRLVAGSADVESVVQKLAKHSNGLVPRTGRALLTENE
jgi:hypothetical protein